MDEVRLALEKGYRIRGVQISGQYNPVTGEGGSFVDYINTFLKLKE